MTGPTHLGTQLKATALGLLLCVITLPVACNVKTGGTRQPGEATAENRVKAVKEKQVMDEVAQQARDEEVQRQAAQEREERQQQLEARTAQQATEKGLPCEGGRCTILTVLQATWVTITRTDANGYKQVDSAPVERLSMSVDGQTEDPKSYQGGVGLGAGDVGTIDLLCWKNCPDLGVGTTHFMGSGTDYTHCAALQSGNCVEYAQLPYLSIGQARWQVLEKCSRFSDDRCKVVSTLNDR